MSYPQLTAIVNVRASGLENTVIYVSIREGREGREGEGGPGREWVEFVVTRFQGSGVNVRASGLENTAIYVSV